MALFWKVRIPAALMPLAVPLRVKFRVELAPWTRLLTGKGVPLEALAFKTAPLMLKLPGLGGTPDAVVKLSVPPVTVVAPL